MIIGLLESAAFHPNLRWLILRYVVDMLWAMLTNIKFPEIKMNSSHHHQEVYMAQLSLFLHKGGIKPPHSFIHWVSRVFM